MHACNGYHGCDKLLTTTTSLMDGWMDDVCMLLCDEEMEFLPGAMMMTVAEISVS